MREIKFRAWDTKARYMVAEYFQIKNTPKHYILLQYTGLKDKNGKEIWEGDVIDGGGFGPTVVRIGEFQNKESYDGREEGVGVYFESVRGGEITGTWLFKGAPIIGNIYENPELLKV